MIRILFLWLLIALSEQIIAQQDKTLFLMHELPQANIVNPAVGIRCRYYVGIPLFSSIHFNYSNTLAAPNELITQKPGSDSLMFNLQKVVGQTHKVDLYSTEAQITLVDFGYQWEDNYFTFSIRENINAFSTTPQDLIYLSYYGNSMFLGETASLKGVRVNATHYREYSFGFSKNSSDKLRLGFHAKLLFGKSNTTTSQYAGSLYTDPTTFQITTQASYIQNLSAPVNIIKNPDGTIKTIELQDNISYMDYLFNRKNIGLAVDFGAIYNLNKKVTLSASVLDLGNIFWQTNAQTIHSKGTYTFQGEVNGSGNGAGIGDSIKNSYQVKTGYNSYFSPLVPRVYLGATYLFTPKLKAGMTYYSEILRNKLHSSLGVSLTTNYLGNFQGSLLWSAQNSVYTNIGIGLGYKAGSVHYHLTTDNVMGFIFPMSTRNANIRFGVNLLLGCNAKKIARPSSIPCVNKRMVNDSDYNKTKYKAFNRQKPPKHKKR